MKREKGENGKYVCPCCGYATLDEVNKYEICKICFWEDDGQDDPKADECLRGPNLIGLTQARINFLQVGASNPKDLAHVKAPKLKDINIREHKLINGKAVANTNTYNTPHKHPLS
jgi:hypothetical protein